jgi:hypothetical protein
MTNELAVVPENALLRMYWDCLGHWQGEPNSPVGPTSGLIPWPHVQQMLEEIGRILEPASREFLDLWLSEYAASWLDRGHDVEQSVLFLGLLGDEVEEFPSWILTETLRRLRRTLTFRPAIAQVYTDADERRAPWLLKQKLLRDHSLEHQRRALPVPAAPANE